MLAPRPRARNTDGARAPRTNTRERDGGCASIRRVRLVPLASLALSIVLGCGGPPALSTRRLEGEPGTDDEDAGEPLVLGTVTLPALPASVHADDEVVHDALGLAREAAVPERPALSDDAAAADVIAYMNTEFHDWMLSRARAIGTARTALRTMEHGDTDEYVLASAIVGALFAMLAEEVATLPLPRSIRDDAHQRVLVREALLETAAPLYQRAVDAFGGCASSAVSSADPTLDPWATYCDAAIRAAEEAPRPVDAPGARADHAREDEEDEAR
jgi:hypothetical protein